jgi:predicted Zn-ribbon and HTH transcriptional regulator
MIVVVIIMKLRCSHCGHVWETRKDKIPTACPRCKYTTWYYKPVVIKG